MTIRERLETLSRGELIGLVVVVGVTMAGAGLWYVRSLPKPVQVATAGQGLEGAPASAAASVQASPEAPPVIVDVTGWVHQPGVYEFAQGDRVIDAVERAGGARNGADLSVLNLAAPLTDGTQVVVPKQGAGGPAAAAPAAEGSGSSGGLININTASETDLEALSGIGEVLAAAIVDYRTDNGPFASVDDLESVSGIGPATLEEIRDQVTV
ncbi:MAG TPA: helix-hairpin-helix domain-containing protein [Actinomycetota bacterium]|jgi:competence protein ComEA|nr:helix-hairpin-helix domain-containing protein [Actinomycetota bacterium]